MNIGYPRSHSGDNNPEPVKLEITVKPEKNVKQKATGQPDMSEQFQVTEATAKIYYSHDKYRDKDDDKRRDKDDDKCRDKDDDKCRDKDDDKCRDKDDDKCRDKDDDKCRDKDDDKCRDKDHDKCRDKDDDKCRDKDDDKCRDKDDDKCRDKDDDKCRDKDDDKCRDKDDDKCRDKDDDKCRDKDDDKCRDKDDDKCRDKDDDKCRDKDDDKCRDKDHDHNEKTRTFTLCPEHYCKSDVITVKSCDDFVCYNLGEFDMKQNGFILELSLKLKNLCPKRCTALAVILYELDECDKEYTRGFKTVLLPPTGKCDCDDICVKCLHFVVPAGLDVSGDCRPCGPRRFVARYIANYVDSDFSVCCDDKH